MKINKQYTSLKFDILGRLNTTVTSNYYFKYSNTSTIHDSINCQKRKF